MENKLEQLLNSLIKRGRVPFVDEKIHSFEIIYVTGKVWNIVAKRGRGQVNKHYSIIELCSKSSGLWQFVCENGMVDRYKYDSKTYEVRIENWIKRREIGPEGEVSINNSWRGRGSAEYRLIESALCDEDKLEEFLLSNIKAEG